MKNFSGNGDTITIVAAADVSAGDVYQGADGIGVYHEDALTGESVAVWVKGEFLLPTTIALTASALDGVDWDGSGIIAAVAAPNAGLLGDNYTSAASVKVIIG